MPDFCTCGAELPPDALFCHKCGKPQREIAVPEVQETPVPEVAPPPPIAAPAITPLNFRNPIAVRIALLVSVIATLLSFLPFLNWTAAGFFAVFFYKRKTGSLLNVSAGVRMGWITGLLMFSLWSVIFIVQQVPAALSGKLSNMLLDQMQRMPAQDPMVRQMMTNLFQSGPGLAAVLVLLLGAFFCFITGLSMAGGAIGAKIVGRD